MSIIFVIFCAIFLTVPEIGIVGKLAFWGVLAAYYLRLLVRNNGRLPTYPLWPWTITLLCGWILLRAQNGFGLYNAVLLCLLMIFLITKIKFVNVSKSASLTLFYSLCALSIITSISGDFFTNKNIGALFMIISTFICVSRFIDKKKKWLFICFGLICTLIYDSRSVILALLLSGLEVYISKKFSISIGKVLLFTILIFTFAIISFWETLWSASFNEMVLEQTGKNFQSGRQAIWGAIFSVMNGWDWVIGKGGGINHADIVPAHYANMSLHSSYIYFIFHYGAIGLLLFWTLLYKCIRRLMLNKAYFSAIIFLFFAFRDFFEITIVNNQMVIAFIFWAWAANGWADEIRHPLKEYRQRNEPILKSYLGA